LTESLVNETVTFKQRSGTMGDLIPVNDDQPKSTETFTIEAGGVLWDIGLRSEFVEVEPSSDVLTEHQVEVGMINHGVLKHG